MSEQTQKTPTGSSPIRPPRLGTVRDVRTLPPIIPKDIKELLEEFDQILGIPQKGTLKDNETDTEETFISNCKPALKPGDEVRYQPLPNNPNFDAIVICK